MKKGRRMMKKILRKIRFRFSNNVYYCPSIKFKCFMIELYVR
jgi:hypothetical protein